ncbi:MAG: mandelate racemase/muconate lactonizing enzyme family protein [Bacteroidales bacterium]
MKKKVSQSSEVSLTSDVEHLRRSRLGFDSSLSVSGLPDQESDLSITEVKAWTLREPISKQAYTVVKIQTRSGIVGFGECAPISREEFSGAKKAITGLPATSAETAASVLTGFPTARAALNIAMLDVVGKATKAPVFQLLGGPTRFKARVITGITGDSDASLINSMNRVLKAGFKAFMVPLPLITNRNQGQAYVLATKKRLESLRAAGGENIDFVLDGGNKLTPGDAQMISNAIETFHVLWFDEPCPPVNIGTFKKISGENVTPIGIGRHIIETGEIQNLIREDAVDIIRPDIGLNGISQIRKMAVIAETNYIAVGPTHNGGPIGTAAALHLAASIPNFFIQQIPFPEAEEDQRMRSDLTLSQVEIIKDGFAELPIDLGLGIAVNEKSLEKYKEASFL